MALQALSPQELAESPTLFASFMGRAGRRHRTLGELLAIYRERSPAIDAEHDADHDLRVERFKRDMLGRRWRDSVVVRVGEFDGRVRIVDGVHRALAYLSCLEDGVGPERLPALQVDR